MKARFRKRTQGGIDLNVTSLVDVAFCLLVVFMMVAPMMQAGVEIDLPETQGNPVSVQEEPIVVTVSSKGEVFFGESTIPTPNLQKALNSHAGIREGKTVYVRADERAEYGKVLEILAQIQTAGVKSVSLVSEATQ